MLTLLWPGTPKNERPTDSRITVLWGYFDILDRKASSVPPPFGSNDANAQCAAGSARLRIVGNRAATPSVIPDHSKWRMYLTKVTVVPPASVRTWNSSINARAR